MIMKPGNHKLKFFSVFLFFLSCTLNAKQIEGIITEIQILDKITAKVSSLKIKVNQSIQFESLNIKIFACYKNPPEEIPENFVLLRISDQLTSNKQELIYQGWMISSSPSTTPLEHPIYDLWIKDCNTEIDF